jgi:hypothetical protein
MKTQNYIEEINDINLFSVNISIITIIQFFIYVPSQQLQGQLQTQHSVVQVNYIKVKTATKIKLSLQQAVEAHRVVRRQGSHTF